MTAPFTEAVIRDQLAHMIDLIDARLTLIEKERLIPNRLGTRGFVDLFARDDDGRYVVIEVKRTDSAAREAAHEILKYVDGVKRHLSLRDDEIRVIVAAVEWRELIVPFSSLAELIKCPIEAYAIHIDTCGQVIGIERKAPLILAAERLIAPWHTLYFYTDEAALAAGLRSVQASFAVKAIEDYVILRLVPAAGNEAGLVAPKQITMLRALSEVAAVQSMLVGDDALPRYKAALYVAMQQLTEDGYVTLIEALTTDREELDSALDETDDDTRICALHECLTGRQPWPDADFVEIAYPAKLQRRLDEGWTIAEVIRHGAFARNAMLTDETIVEEMKGGQGASQQKYSKVLSLADAAQVTEAKRGIATCLRDNGPWRDQISTALDSACRRTPHEMMKIVIFNPAAGLLTLYQAATQPPPVQLWIPTYSLYVPPALHETGEGDGTLYFGSLLWNGHKPNFNTVLTDHFNGDIHEMLWPLMGGGYTRDDVAILASLGLRYRSFRLDIIQGKRRFYRLSEGSWKANPPADPFAGVFAFIQGNPEFMGRLIHEYASRWDGGLVDLSASRPPPGP